jgi:hypothetical protein
MHCFSIWTGGPISFGQFLAKLRRNRTHRYLSTAHENGRSDSGARTHISRNRHSAHYKFCGVATILNYFLEFIPTLEVSRKVHLEGNTGLLDVILIIGGMICLNVRVVCFCEGSCSLPLPLFFLHQYDV